MTLSGSPAVTGIRVRTSSLVPGTIPLVPGVTGTILFVPGVYTQSTMHVPLASNASSTPDAELRSLQEYCCALLNKSPDTRGGDMDAQLALYTTNE